MPGLKSPSVLTYSAMGFALYPSPAPGCAWIGIGRADTFQEVRRKRSKQRNGPAEAGSSPLKNPANRGMRNLYDAGSAAETEPEDESLNS